MIIYLWLAQLLVISYGQMDCGRPRQTGYEFSYSSTWSGDIATASCADGYAGTANDIVCDFNGQWDSATGCSGN
jgi:hypothetical protein